jgi:Transposase DDE domain
MGVTDHEGVKVPGDARGKPRDLPIGEYKELLNRRGYYLGRVFFLVQGGFVARTQGFLQSIFELMKLDLTAPDHSTLSRRRRQLTITLPAKNLSKSIHLVIDSTGVKVYGEGEWKVRQHGVGKRRTWLKLLFCANEATLEIFSVVAGANDVSYA